MHKKDYEALAAALLNARCAHGLNLSPINTCVEEIADALAADSPRFNRERFYRACGYVTTESAR